MKHFKFEASILCPINEEEANEIYNNLKNRNDFDGIEVYLFKDCFRIITIGTRTYKYGKNVQKGIISKIDYSIKNANEMIKEFQETYK